MKYTGYVYTYFLAALNGNEEVQQVHMAASRDGLFWQDLNDVKPVMTSNLGTKGARDTVILRDEKNHKFYVIATDLDSNGGDWYKYATQGSLDMIVWESEDLVNWSEPWAVTIADENMAFMWAPRAFYDEINEEFIVYWSSDEKGGHGKSIYCAKTKDFKTFTKQQMYLPCKFNEHPEQLEGAYITYIDAAVYKYKDTVYRFTKRENDVTIFLETSDSFFGDFKLVKEKIAGEDGVEGPDIYKLNDQEKWILMMDGYCLSNPGVGYFPLIAESEEDLKNGNFRRLKEGEYKMPTGAKHGAIIPVTEEEYQAVMAKWGK